jgi:hypothetical protein
MKNKIMWDKKMELTKRSLVENLVATIIKYKGAVLDNPLLYNLKVIKLFER